MAFRSGSCIATPKIDLEKFKENNDFNIWKIKVEVLLITQGVRNAIEPVSKKEGKKVSSSKTPNQAAEIDKKIKSTLLLSLGDSVIRKMAKKKTISKF